jgi:hypothetical protein
MSMARLVLRITGRPESSVQSTVEASFMETSRFLPDGGRSSRARPPGPHGSSRTMWLSARHTFHSRGSTDRRQPGSWSSADSSTNERLS